MVHATGFFRDVFLLPCRLGAVLDHQQHVDDSSAVADQQKHGRYDEVPIAQVQVTGVSLANKGCLCQVAAFFIAADHGTMTA